MSTECYFIEQRSLTSWTALVCADFHERGTNHQPIAALPILAPDPHARPSKFISSQQHPDYQPYQRACVAFEYHMHSAVRRACTLFLEAYLRADCLWLLVLPKVLNTSNSTKTKKAVTIP